jgi:hypothetical protein
VVPATQTPVWKAVSCCVIASPVPVSYRNLFKTLPWMGQTLSYCFCFFVFAHRELQVPPVPPGASSAPVPACFRLSQRNLSCIEGKSIGSSCQPLTGAICPASEERYRLWRQQKAALDLGSWSLHGAQLGLV